MLLKENFNLNQDIKTFIEYDNTHEHSTVIWINDAPIQENKYKVRHKCIG